MTELDRYGHPVERVTPERPPQPRPLSTDEIEGLLDLVVAYTRREPDKSMVQVWAAQSLLGRWTYDEAATAIHRWGYNRPENGFLEPSDVTRLIRADRQDAAQRAEQAWLESRPADPAAAERIRDIVNGLAAQMGWADDDSEAPAQSVLSVACPFCHSGIGQPCTRPGQGGTVRRRGAHPSRREAAA